MTLKHSLNGQNRIKIGKEINAEIQRNGTKLSYFNIQNGNAQSLSRYGPHIDFYIYTHQRMLSHVYSVSWKFKNFIEK